MLGDAEFETRIQVEVFYYIYTIFSIVQKTVDIFKTLLSWITNC